MKAFVTVPFFLFLFSNPLFAQVWTVDDEIHEVGFIIERMTRMQQETDPSSIEHTFYVDKLKYLENRLSLLQESKDGDVSAGQTLMLNEERCTKLIDFSARLLGISGSSFSNYLRQCNARLKMFNELSGLTEKEDQ